MNLLRYRWLVFVLPIGVLVVIGYAFFAWNSGTTAVRGLDRTVWETYAEHHSSQQIREALITEGKNLSYNDSHALAHVVGEVLYEKIGVNGIAACGDEYAYGCYHGFAGRALQEKGLDSVTAVNEGCRTSEDPLGCQHGVGHGVLSFLGNGEILQALTLCDALHQASSVGGCFGGVFMEYNFNTMQSPSGIEVRPFIDADALLPCAMLPLQFQDGCYFDQPAWWHASALPDGTEVERFTRDGELCNRVRHKENRDICYRGIGNVVAPTSGFSEPVMREWCGKMPNAGAQATCLDQAKHHNSGSVAAP